MARKLFGGGDRRPKTDSRESPSLAGLGTRVEQILRLAEDQASARLDKAARKADQIVAEARLQAAEIIKQARAEAATLNKP
jgi:F0F1-type ATP synthase membrane subunit b/b'